MSIFKMGSTALSGILAEMTQPAFGNQSVRA